MPTTEQVAHTRAADSSSSTGGKTSLPAPQWKVFGANFISFPESGITDLEVLVITEKRGEVEEEIAYVTNEDGEGEARGRLIAAAPALLEQLQENIGYIPCTCEWPRTSSSENGHDDSCARWKVQQVIDRATGGAQ